MHHCPGGFLEALGRGVAALACSSRGVLADKYEPARGWRAVGRLRVQGSFMPMVVSALCARLFTHRLVVVCCSRAWCAGGSTDRGHQVSPAAVFR